MFYFQLYERRILEITENISPENAALVNSIIHPIGNTYADLVAYSVLATVLVSATFGLLISHRVAGPIYRTLQILQHLTEGKKVKTPIRLRNGDFFPELQQALTNIAEHLQNDPPNRPPNKQ